MGLLFSRNDLKLSVLHFEIYRKSLLSVTWGILKTRPDGVKNKDYLFETTFSLHFAKKHLFLIPLALELF